MLLLILSSPVLLPLLASSQRFMHAVNGIDLTFLVLRAFPLLAFVPLVLRQVFVELNRRAANDRRAQKADRGVFKAVRGRTRSSREH